MEGEGGSERESERGGEGGNRRSTIHSMRALGKGTKGGLRAWESAEIDLEKGNGSQVEDGHKMESHKMESHKMERMRTLGLSMDMSLATLPPPLSLSKTLHFVTVLDLRSITLF